MADVRVGEIMIPLEKYPTVREDNSLLQAMRILEKSRLEVAGRRSLPRVLLVIDKNNQLVGFIRRRHILRGMEPDFLVEKPLEYRKKLFDIKTDPNLSELSYDRVFSAVREKAKLRVGSFMKPLDVTIDFNDHVFKAIYEMNINRLSLLPIVKNDEVVGIVRTVDVFHEVAKMLDAVE